MALLEIKDLSLEIGPFPVLRDIDLSVDAGEIVACRPAHPKMAEFGMNQAVDRRTIDDDPAADARANRQIE